MDLKARRRESLHGISSQPILDVRGLTIRYVPPQQKAVHAVSRVDLHVHAGEVLGIMGESGSGKSTLSSAILKLLPPQAKGIAGSVLFEGQDVLTTNESDLCRIRGARLAMIHQDPASSLNPVLSIGTQISEVLRAHMSLNKRRRKTRVLELLREVGFDDAERIAAAYPHELSGGQRQRVVIAQAIACSPALLIADEPTSKLDSRLQGDILELLTNIVRRHGTALILITHDPAVLIGIADRTAVMYAGSIVEEGSTEEILQNPLHPYTQALLQLFNSERGCRASKVDQFPIIAGELPDLTQSAPSCRFEPRCRERMSVCAVQDPQESTIPQGHRVSCFKYAE